MYLKLLSCIKIISIVFIFIIFVTPVIVPTKSMENTIMPNDMILFNNLSYNVSNSYINYINIPLFPDYLKPYVKIFDKHPKRGDIVSFVSDKLDKNGHNINYVKRCVALSGDIIYIKNKNLYIKPKKPFNKKFFNKKNIDKNGFYKAPFKKFIKLDKNNKEEENMNFNLHIVKNNSCFVLGDNRDYSYDSRFFGDINFNKINGKPIFIYYSNDITRIGKFI